MQRKKNVIVKAYGGQIMQRKKNVTVKYTNEACGMFSVACPKVYGDTKGKFLPMFWYTGQNFASINGWGALK